MDNQFSGMDVLVSLMNQVEVPFAALLIDPYELAAFIIETA